MQPSRELDAEDSPRQPGGVMSRGCLFVPSLSATRVKCANGGRVLQEIDGLTLQCSRIEVGQHAADACVRVDQRSLDCAQAIGSAEVG